jgi:hypothetical protein
MNAAALISPVVFLVKPTSLWRPTKVNARASLGVVENVLD